MKILIAIDSLKGSITSMEAGCAIKTAINNVYSNATVVVKPLADGGEGTTDALIEGLNGIRQVVSVVDPINRNIQAYYGYIKQTNTAIIEMAMASGITLVSSSELNPLETTTYGVGLMIKDAIDRGIRNFIIGIGGSATNDGGIGMLQALGYSFLDKNGNEVPFGAKGLSMIEVVDLSKVNQLLKECSFKVACDVDNPLYGENGATYIYGPQKGVTELNKEEIDNAMKHYAKISTKYLNNNFALTPGSGAAGGLGFAFISYLNAQLIKGVDLVIEAIELEDEIKDADLVVTGEGRLDQQTIMGKAPIGVAKLAKKYNKKVIAFAGAVTPDAVLCNEHGIDAYFPIVRGVSTLDEALSSVNATNNMIDTVTQVFKLIKTVRGD